jgi:hypothetical protein
MEVRREGEAGCAMSAESAEAHLLRRPQCVQVLIPHLKRRTILRPCLPPVVEPGGGNIGMPEPLLHLGDVGSWSSALVAAVAHRECAPNPSMFTPTRFA